MPSHLCILVIEDDARMAELLRAGLAERGHSVMVAQTAEEGLELIDRESFDAIVLDIGLPGKSGYAVAAQLSQRTNRPAMVMLTALNQEDSVVCGLDAGADDYLTKPFSFPELAARLIAATRRTRMAAAGKFCFGPFQLDIAQRRLWSGQTEIFLSRSEYLLLRALALKRGEAVSRRKLMQAVWGTTAIRPGALDTLMNTLRDKLDAEQTGLIATIRGIGYCLAEDTELRKELAC
jgi:DNA-binding response OmpR family regulator